MAAGVMHWDLCYWRPHLSCYMRSDGEARMETVRSAHTRYCQKQQENSKTLRVLQSAFGEEFAMRYMNEVMFDAPLQQQAEAAVPC